MNRAAKACGLGVALAATLAAGAAGASPIKISEVLYDASGSDDGKVFVELFGPAGLGLDGYTLEGVNGADGAVGPVLALVGFIPADGIYVVADRDTSGVTFVPYTDLLLNFDLQNGPDSLVLRDPAGNVVDALGYGAFGMGAYAGEGMPAPDAPAGHSLARRFANLDTDDNAVDFVVLAIPTPGFAAVPEPRPGDLVLFGLGLCALGSMRARRREPPATAR